jgi:hypothetical protein
VAAIARTPAAAEAAPGPSDVTGRAAAAGAAPVPAGLIGRAPAAEAAPVPGDLTGRAAPAEARSEPAPRTGGARVAARSLEVRDRNGPRAVVARMAAAADPADAMQRGPHRDAAASSSPAVPLSRLRQADATTTTTNGLSASGAGRSAMRLRRPSSQAIARAASADADPTPAPSRNGATGQRALARADTGATTATPGTTDATRLAAMTGGSLVGGADGRASVVFASGGQPARRLARATHTTHTASVQRTIPESAPAPAPIDVDDLYEQIAARLRRDLLLDRERAGELP